MRIKCPFCGERSLEEFAYHGDATVTRPDLAEPDAMEKFTAYVYERTNPAGRHRELWYHAAGCHAWLVVARDTVNHKISEVEAARDVALRRAADAQGEA
jgi:sarcosine oxidase subunit delta